MKNTVHAGPLTADEIAAEAEAEAAEMATTAEPVAEHDDRAGELTVKVTATASSKRKPTTGKDKG